MQILAPAKLNLFLHITGKRADGFHLLQSLVVFLDIGDTIKAELQNTLSLDVTGEFANALFQETDNLILRTANALAPYTTQRAALCLEKQLPVGAGLGGGSADAAAALQLLCKLWEIKLLDETLHTIAASLGSDVVVCLHGKTAIMEGVGDVLLPAPTLPPLHLVLIHPRKPLLTKNVYGGFHGTFSETIAFSNTLNFKELIMVLQNTRNDLEVPAMALLPDIAEMIRILKTQHGCALARMSGSGSACFGIFNTENEAITAVRNIQQNHVTWWVKHAVTAS